MTLNFLTIVHNGMPFIERHYPIFAQLRTPWNWSIAHGPAANVACTRWCREQPKGLSTDGTTKTLKRLTKLPNVAVIEREMWKGGKLQMVNSAIEAFTREGVLLQVDVDEIWTTHQLETIVKLLEINKKAMRAYFKCRYFFGPDIVVVPSTDPNNNWLRAWWFRPGMVFQSHEPPVLCGNQGPAISVEDSERAGVVFDHFAYFSEAQVAYKEKFYGYTGAVNGWRNLQENRKWPIEVHHFLPWCPKGVMVTRLPPTS